tara:strand:- start:4256 stop:5647 length:1392 start_codon:yes stop_codon:yes gene_type:complete
VAAQSAGIIRGIHGIQAFAGQGRILRISVIGLGHVGCPLAAVMAERGHDVTGIDQAPAVVEQINSAVSQIAEPGLDIVLKNAVSIGKLTAQTSLDGLADADAIIIAVGTPIDDNGEADLGALKGVCRDIADVIVDGQIVILKSTVPPGTTDSVVVPILSANADIDVAFCPERLAEGQAIRDLRRLPVVVGGMTPKATQRATVFFESALGVDCIPVSGTRSSELVKLADNLWIDLNIALANEIAKLADTLGVDAHEIISAANSLPKGQHHVNILSPSMGVGGSCLTKDPWFLEAFARDNGIEMHIPAVSRGINDGMPAYAVGRITDALSRARPDILPGDLKIAVLGITYKSDTSDCRFSPAKPAIEVLIDKGYDVAIHDPLVTPVDARMVTDLPLQPSVDETIEGADCVAFFTAHSAFSNLDADLLGTRLAHGAVVFDGRMLFSPKAVSDLKKHGLQYVGVGRT